MNCRKIYKVDKHIIISNSYALVEKKLEEKYDGRYVGDPFNYLMLPNVTKMQVMKDIEMFEISINTKVSKKDRQFAFVSEDVQFPILMSVEDIHDIMQLYMVNKSLKKMLEKQEVFLRLKKKYPSPYMPGFKHLYRLYSQLENTKVEYDKENRKLPIGTRMYSYAQEYRRERNTKNYVVVCHRGSVNFVKECDAQGFVIKDAEEEKLQYLPKQNRFKIAECHEANVFLEPGLLLQSYGPHIEHLNSNYLKFRITIANNWLDLREGVILEGRRDDNYGKKFIIEKISEEDNVVIRSLKDLQLEKIITKKAATNDFIIVHHS